MIAQMYTQLAPRGDIFLKPQAQMAAYMTCIACVGRNRELFRCCRSFSLKGTTTKAVKYLSQTKALWLGSRVPGNNALTCP